jgi:hypothetical protein
MSKTSRAAAGTAALVLCTLPLVHPAVAADNAPSRTKAGIEYAERQVAATTDLPSKAQVERDERESAGGTGPRSPEGGTGSTGGDGGAAAWQLGLSAALGAALTGGVLVAAQQMRHHRQAVAH